MLTYCTFNLYQYHNCDKCTNLQDQNAVKSLVLCRQESEETTGVDCGKQSFQHLLVKPILFTCE